MGKVYEKLNDKIKDFIGHQKMFWVSTAPLAADGFVNCSPKGFDCLRILDDNKVAYIDLTGSAAETAAHLRENGRIVLLFCAFDGPPKIIRLHGKGAVHELGTDGFERLKVHFPGYFSARAIYEIDLLRISDSCGFTVPEYEYKAERFVKSSWNRDPNKEGIEKYREIKNTTSLDGLPALNQE